MKKIILLALTALMIVGMKSCLRRRNIPLATNHDKAVEEAIKM